MGVARSTIQDNLKRAAAAGLAWPLADDVTDESGAPTLRPRHCCAGPAAPEFAEWRRARVNLDYHIEVHGFLYSVPHALIRAEVEVRTTARTLEIFHGGQRVGVHQRRYTGAKHGTNPDHMPSSHRRYAEWTPKRLRRWAGKIGPNTEGLISAALASRRRPEQGFRTCLGILRSYRGLDPARVEAVSARALELGALNCKGVTALLARKDDNAAKDSRPPTLLDHANLRGPGYYH